MGLGFGGSWELGAGSWPMLPGGRGPRKGEREEEMWIINCVIFLPTLNRLTLSAAAAGPGDCRPRI